MRRAIIAFAVAAIAAGIVAPVAGAATKDAHGWWWRAQSGLLGTAIPPPGVPEDGLAVETLPDGPTAISAVRYLLDKGESQPVLELTVADQQGEIAIQACTATQHWQPAHGGPWEQRPTYDCGTAVEGAPSEDGTTWRWDDLSALLQDRRLNIVLVPAPGSGRVTFEPPDDGSLQTTRKASGGPGGQNFDPPPVSDFTDPEPPPRSAPANDFSPPPSNTTPAPAGSQAQPFSPAPGRGTAAGPAQSPALTTPGDSAALPPPQAAAPVAPQAAQAEQALPAPVGETIPASSDSSRTMGLVIAAMATLLGLALWHQDTSGPRRAGAAGSAGGGQSIGGLGRFARARTGSPRPLV